MNLDLFDPKTAQRFRDLAAQVQLARETGANHGVVLADAVQALKRLNKRAESLSDDWERVEIVPQRGATLEFSGRLLASDEFESRGADPMRVSLEIWETQGGALVAVFSSEPATRKGVEVVNAAVVPAQADAHAMRLAVMDFFDWDNRARTMARKLGWNLRVEVD
jgi:hypothetical protein